MMMIKLTADLVREHGLTPEEYERITKILKREPNINELGMYSVLWSEHCSYKHSKNQLKKFPTTGKYVLQGPGENAGIVDIGDGIALSFKMESHNHPSAVEPYQGAATGVGGILRDIFTMGARPIASLNSLRFGNIQHSKRSRFLLDGVVAGIAGYGNCVGVPTVGGDIYFDDCYEGNCLVNAMSIGVVQSGEQKIHELYGPIAKGRAAGVGNIIFYVGSATGRDGIHGATFASVELSEQSEEKRSSVQVGDPFQEKLLIEACLELLKEDCVVGMQDMGAAGLTSSLSEMASRSNTGVEINIDLVPRREEGMTPYEILLSESQERMIIIIEKGKEDHAFRIFTKWQLHAVAIGKVTNDLMFRILEKGNIAAEVPARSLADDAPLYNPKSKRPAYLTKVQSHDFSDLPDITAKNAGSVLKNLLSLPSIASKRWIYEQYDQMVQTNTIIRPGAADAAVLRIKGTDKIIAMTSDCNSRFCYLDPYEGGKAAVAEAARNLVCTGAQPIALTDCLNYGNPEKPEMFYTFEKSLEGLCDACRALDVPVISGNVSFYNENNGKAIYPTPMIGMVGLISNITHITTNAFKQAGDLVFLLGTHRNELGGSHYISLITHQVIGKPPHMDLNAEAELQDKLLAAIQQGLIQSAHDSTEGGLTVAIAECSFTNNLGAIITLENNDLRYDALLFGETHTRVIVSIQPKNEEQLLKIFEGFPCHKIGIVHGNTLSIAINEQNLINSAISELKSCYENAIPELMKG